MTGIYFYSDFCSGRIWGLSFDGTDWQNTEYLDSALFVSSFGEDVNGEVYVVDFNGGVYRLEGTTSTTSTPSAKPTRTPSTPVTLSPTTTGSPTPHPTLTRTPTGTPTVSATATEPQPATSTPTPTQAPTRPPKSTRTPTPSKP